MVARSPSPFGQHLKRWRRLRRLSQLELSLEAEVTQRHLSFIETGRSRPGRDVVLRLAQALDMPLRDRNTLLGAAGFAPVFPEATLDDDALAPFRAMVDQMLERHAPWPAIAVDRHWNVVRANAAARALWLQGRDPATSQVNAMRLMFTGGVGRAMVENWPEIGWSSIVRLRRELEQVGEDPALEALLEECLGAMAGVPQPPPEVIEAPAIVVHLKIGPTRLRTVTAIARFGSAREITLDELRIELVFPADDATDAFFRSGPWAG